MRDIPAPPLLPPEFFRLPPQAKDLVLLCWRPEGATEDELLSLVWPDAADRDLDVGNTLKMAARNGNRYLKQAGLRAWFSWRKGRLYLKGDITSVTQVTLTNEQIMP